MYEYLEEGENRYSLHNLTSDPSESNKLAEENPDQLGNMMEEIKAAKL